MPHQLLYVSTPVAELKSTEVAAMVVRSRINNQARVITGFMCGSSRFFIQCLEGDQTAVEALFDVIRQDPRHHKIQVLLQGPCDSSIFSNWSMGCVLNIEKHRQILSRYTVAKEFDPYALSPEQCLDLLVEFSELKNI